MFWRKVRLLFWEDDHLFFLFHFTNFLFIFISDPEFEFPDGSCLGGNPSDTLTVSRFWLQNSARVTQKTFGFFCWTATKVTTTSDPVWHFYSIRSKPFFKFIQRLEEAFTMLYLIQIPLLTSMKTNSQSESADLSNTNVISSLFVFSWFIFIYNTLINMSWMILIWNLLFLNEADFIFFLLWNFIKIKSFVVTYSRCFTAKKNQVKFISCALDQQEVILHPHIKMNGFNIHF